MSKIVLTCGRCGTGGIFPTIHALAKHQLDGCTGRVQRADVNAITPPPSSGQDLRATRERIAQQLDRVFGKAEAPATPARTYDGGYR